MFSFKFTLKFTIHGCQESFIVGYANLFCHCPLPLQLRHIENHVEAAPGTSVLLDSVMDLPKKKSSRAARCKGVVLWNTKLNSTLKIWNYLLTTTLSWLAEGRQAADNKGLSKHQGRSQQSPEKSSSRSPLRNTTQDSNVHTNNSVEFREPLASYRYKQHWIEEAHQTRLWVRVLVGENKTVFPY